MTVRILSWNIFNFAGGGSGVMSKADALSRLLEVVHPTGGGPAFDVFVIIEPVTQKQKIGALAVGGGPDGGVQMLGLLRARQEGKWWRIITPVCIYSAAPSKAGKGETVLIFYDSRVVAARGPDGYNAPGGAWDNASARKGDLHWIDAAVTPAQLITSGLHEGGRAGVNFGTQPAGAAFDPANKHVYWIERALNRVCRCDLDGQNAAALTAASAGTPRLLTMSGNDVLWEDAFHATIWRADATSGNAAVSIPASGGAVALAAINNKLVWATANDLWSADLDGTNAGALVANAGTVESMCGAGKYVYWTDTVSGEIRSCDLTNPVGQPLVAALNAHGPSSLTAAANVYWIGGTDIYGHDLLGNVTTSLIAGAQAAGQLVADATAGLVWVQTSGAIAQAALDGTGSQVLVPAVNSGTPASLSIGNNRIYWIDTASGEIRSVATDGTDFKVTVTNADARTPSRLRAGGNKIFWVTAGEAVFSANADGTSPAAIWPRADSLALEPASNVMFWIDRAAETIRSAQLDGNTPAVAIAAAVAGNPHGVAATNAKLYWLDAANQIGIADHNGGSAQVAVTAANAGTPGSLAASTVTNKIYWTDTTSHEIRSADLDGTNHAQFVAAATAGQPSMLHAGTTHLSWIDSATGDIHWTPLDDGAKSTVLVQSSVVGQPLAYAVAAGADHWHPDILSNIANTASGFPKWDILNERESCPMRARFLDITSGHEFDLVAQHAPSPTYGGKKKNKKAQKGVEAFRAHAATSQARVVYLGDLNLCYLGGTCEKTNDGHATDVITLNAFTATPPTMTLVQHGQRSSLKKDKATATNYTEHAYDHIIAKGHTTSANNGVIDLVAGVIAEYQLANPTTAITKNIFGSGSIFYKIRNTGGSGISDHLPVKADLTF